MCIRDSITHELKTPLTTVSGYAELIANGLVTDEADLRDFGRRIYSCLLYTSRCV